MLVEELMEYILGDTTVELIRGVQPGMLLDTVISREGSAYREYSSYLPSLEYVNELDPGKKIRSTYYYDANKLIAEMNIFFEYNLYEHDDDSGLFDDLVREVKSRLVSLHGECEEAVKGKGMNKEVFYYWKFPKEENRRITLIEYFKEDPYDSVNDEFILKLIYAKNQ